MGCSDSKPTHQSNGNGKVKPTPANKTKDEERVNRRDMPKLDQTERRKSMAPDRKSIDAARSATPTGSDQMSAKGSPKHEPDNTSHEPDSTHGIARPPSPKSEEKSTDKSDKSLHHSDSCSRLESDSDIQDITAGSPGNATPMSLSPVAHPAMTPNSPLDTANFDEANVGYDLIDSYDYDAAFKKLMELVKKRDGRMNLVALAGVSSMHGLGGEAWARVSSASVSEVPHQVKEAAEAWLRQRHLSKRATPAFGSPAALLALTELYRMRDKDAPEDFGLQCIYLPTPHPLALLRHSTDTLATFKKERTKDMNPAKLKEMEIEKKVLLRNFDALSKPNTRIGAKAGKYLWMSFYKGADGYARDLERTCLMLERAIHYEMGNVKEMRQYLQKAQDKLGGGRSRGMTSQPSREGPLHTPNQLPKAAREGRRESRSIGRRESTGSMSGRISPNQSGRSISPGGRCVSPSGRSGTPRRGSYTPRCTTPETPGGGMRGRSNSVISEVAATVAYINGMEVLAVKDHSRQASESPRRGKVSSYDRDILAEEEDISMNSSTTPRGSRRRISERGHDIQEMIRRESCVVEPQMNYIQHGQTPRGGSPTPR